MQMLATLCNHLAGGHREGIGDVAGGHFDSTVEQSERRWRGSNREENCAEGGTGMGRRCRSLWIRKMGKMEEVIKGEEMGSLVLPGLYNYSLPVDVHLGPDV